MKLAVIWLTIVISIAFLLHPQITLEVHDGEHWVGGGSYGDWLWNVPDAVAGVRYKTSFAHSVVYCVATLLLAGGVWASSRIPLPRATIPTHATVVTPVVATPAPRSASNRRPRLFEPYMYVTAFAMALLLFFLRECRKIEVRKELERQQHAKEEQLQRTINDAMHRASHFPLK